MSIIQEKVDEAYKYMQVRIYWTNGAGGDYLFPDYNDPKSQSWDEVQVTFTHWHHPNEVSIKMPVHHKLINDMLQPLAASTLGAKGYRDWPKIDIMIKGKLFFRGYAEIAEGEHNYEHSNINESMTITGLDLRKPLFKQIFTQKIKSKKSYQIITDLINPLEFSGKNITISAGTESMNVGTALDAQFWRTHSAATKQAEVEAYLSVELAEGGLYNLDADNQYVTFADCDQYFFCPRNSPLLNKIHPPPNSPIKYVRLHDFLNFTWKRGFDAETYSIELYGYQAYGKKKIRRFQTKEGKGAFVIRKYVGQVPKGINNQQAFKTFGRNLLHQLERTALEVEIKDVPGDTRQHNLLFTYSLDMNDQDQESYLTLLGAPLNGQNGRYFPGIIRHTFTQGSHTMDLHLYSFPDAPF